MIKRVFIVLLVPLALGGCALIGGQKKATYPQQYALLKTSSATSEVQPAHHYPVVLRVAKPTAPGWLGKTAMYYQLVYEQPSRISAYTRSRWVQPPPSMLSQALQQQLSGTHAFKAVTGSAADMSSDLILKVSLFNFEQRFMSRHSSFGVLHATATLVDANSGHVLAQKDFHYQVSAPHANAVGGVQALSTASGKFTGAVAQWVENTLSSCTPQCLGRQKHRSQG